MSPCEVCGACHDYGTEHESATLVSEMQAAADDAGLTEAEARVFLRITREDPK